MRDSSHITKPTSSQRILRRPSTYVNLDKVLANSNHTFPPLTNFPQMVYQISTSDSSRTMTEDHKSRRTAIGTVYPDLRHIYITNEVSIAKSLLSIWKLANLEPQVSTVVQFRHIDYGMEHCTLNHSIPPQSDSKPSVVEVWELDVAVEISRYIGDTWKTAAPRRKMLTTMHFPPNGDTYSFNCPSNEFSTFELACPSRSSACQVDFWQDQRADPITGDDRLRFHLLTIALMHARRDLSCTNPINARTSQSKFQDVKSYDIYGIYICAELTLRIALDWNDVHGCLDSHYWRDHDSGR